MTTLFTFAAAAAVLLFTDERWSAFLAGALFWEGVCYWIVRRFYTFNKFVLLKKE